MAIIRKTSALVESGILSAFAVVFALIGAYIPILSLFANLFWPVPIILIGRRHGLKWSFLCLAVSGIIVSVLVNPIHGLALVAVLGLIGITMGECFRRELPPVKIMLIGSVSAFVALCISFGLGYFLMNIDLIAVFKNISETSFGMTTEFYSKMGLNEEQMKEITENGKLMAEMGKMIFPAAFILFAPFSVFSNYWVACKVLNKLGDNFPWFPPFREWQFPRWFLFVYGIALVLLMMYNTQHDAPLFVVGFNLYAVSSIFLLIQALACASWYINKFNKPKWYFTVAIFLIFLNQVISQIFVLFGAYDMVFDFRHRPGFGKRK